MLRKSSLAIVLAGVLLMPAPAGAQPYPGPAADTTPATCDERTVAFHVKRAKAILSLAYSGRRWMDAHPATRKQVRKWKDHRACLEHRSDRKRITAYQDKRVKRFSRYRAYRLRLQPYQGPNGTRWAIPWYIVACESGGSWSAYNGSGAAGPYQIMAEHGRPWPVDSEAERVAHHQIASRLYAGGSGASNWVCA